MATPDRGFTAPRAIVMYGGVVIGWAENVHVTESIAQFPIKKLGSVFTQQHETVDVTVNGSFDYIHILDKPLSQMRRDGAGEVPAWPNAGAVASGIVNDDDASATYVEYPEATFVLLDKITNKPVLQVFGVKPRDRGWSLSLGTIMTVNASFVARRMVELAVPTRTAS